MCACHAQRCQSVSTGFLVCCLVCEMEDLLKGPYLMTEWNPDLINEILSRLKPCNVRVLAIAKKFENIATDTEPWHGGQYKTEEIKSDLIIILFTITEFGYSMRSQKGCSCKSCSA